MRRLDNIDLRLLHVFMILADAGSFSAAQIALNLTQSTLSTHLASLERKLGGKLCLRGRRGFRLTPFGEATLRAARQLFEDVDAFSRRIHENRDHLVGRLRIGIVDGVVTSPRLGLQRALSHYMERAQDVFIDLHLGTPHDLEQSIAEGRRDVVIGPFAQKVPGVSYVLLEREAHSLYCGRDHPLFAIPAVRLKREDIENAAFSVRGYRHLEDLYRVNHPRASASVIHMEAQVMLILSGHFIGFLPCHIGDSWAEQGLMRALKPQSYQFESNHYAAFRRTEQSNAIIRAFIRALREEVRVAA